MATAVGEMQRRQRGEPASESALTPERLSNIASLTQEKLKRVNWWDVAKQIPRLYWESIRPSKDPVYLLGVGVGLLSNVTGVLNEPIVAGLKIASPLGFHGAKGLAKLTGSELESKFGSGKKLSKFLGGMAAASIVGQIGNIAGAVGAAIERATPVAHAADVAVQSVPAAESVHKPEVRVAGWFTDTPSDAGIAQQPPVLEASDSSAEPYVAQASVQMDVQVGESSKVISVPGVPHTPDVLIASFHSQSPGGDLLDRLHRAVEAFKTPTPGVIITPEPSVYRGPDLSTSTFDLINITDRHTSALPTLFDPNTGINPDVPAGKGNIYPSLEAAYAEAAFENVLAQTTGRYLPSTDLVTSQILMDNHIANPAQLPAALIEHARLEAQGVIEVEITKIAQEKLIEAAQKAGVPVETGTLPYYQGGTIPEAYVDLSKFTDEQYRDLVKSITEAVDAKMSSHAWDKPMHAWGQDVLIKFITEQENALRNIDTIARVDHSSKFSAMPGLGDGLEERFMRINSTAELDQATTVLATNWREISNYVGQHPSELPRGFHLPGLLDLQGIIAEAKKGNKFALAQLLELARVVGESKQSLLWMGDPDPKIVTMILNQIRRP